MKDENRQPKKYDLVLGGNNPPPTDALVLGGIEGVSKRLASNNIEIRIAALSDAIEYNSEGLDLVIDALQDGSEQVGIAAYKLLRSRQEKKVKQAILDFNPYRFFECIYELKTSHNSPGYITFSVDGSKILYCGSNSSRWNPRTGNGGKVIRYIQWNLQSNNELLQPKQSETTYFLFSSTPDDKLNSLYINSSTNTLIAGGNPKQDFEESPFNQIEIINLDRGINSKQIERTNLKVKEIREKQIAHIFCGHSNWGTKQINFALSKDNNILATCSQAMNKSNQRDNSVLVWDLQTGKRLHALSGHTKAVTALAITNNSEILITASEDCIIKTWDIKTGKNILTIDYNSEIASLAINPQNNNLIVSDRAGYIKTYSLETGTISLIINTCDILQKTTNFIGAYSNNHSDFLLVNYDGTVVISRNHEKSSRESSEIIIWNLVTGKYLAKLNHYNVTSIAIAPDGNTIATMGNNKIKVWQTNL